MGQRDAKGRTPLMVAADNGHAELVSILVTPNSVKELAGEALKSVGGEALKAIGLPGFTDRLQKLVDSSSDLSDKNGQTPLMKAAANGHLDVTELGSPFAARHISPKYRFRDSPNRPPI